MKGKLSYQLPFKRAFQDPSLCGRTVLSVCLFHDALTLPDVFCQIRMAPSTKPAELHEQGARMASSAQHFPSGDAEGGIGYWPRTGHVHLLPALD